MSKTGWPKHRVIQYVKLALVEKEDVTIRDVSLNKITKLTLQGEVDKIWKKKELLFDIKDIFDKPCPQLILIVGASGEYHKMNSYKYIHRRIATLGQPPLVIFGAHPHKRSRYSNRAVIYSNEAIERSKK